MPDTVVTILTKIFGGDTPSFPLTAYQISARAIVVYAIGVAIVRLGKTRLISHASLLDVILGFILGSLLSRGITGHAAISDTTIASAALVAMHWLFTALACRFTSFENLIKGHVYPLVQDGKRCVDNMRHSHVSEGDLAEAIRLSGLDDLSQIEAAFKERSGEVSIIKIRDKR